MLTSVCQLHNLHNKDTPVYESLLLNQMPHSSAMKQHKCIDLKRPSYVYVTIGRKPYPFLSMKSEICS